MFLNASFISPKYMDVYKWNAEYYSKKYINLEKKIKTYLVNLGELLEEVTNGPHGGVSYVTEDTDKAVPYLRAQNIEDGFINDKNMVYISEQDHQAHIRAEVVPGDIIITITGVGVGEAAIITNLIEKANIIQSLAKLKVNRKLVDPYYLVTFLNSNSGRLLSYRQTSTTAQAGLNFDAIKNIQIFLPEMRIQNYIGNKVRKAEELREEAKQLKEKISDSIYQMIQLEPLSNNNQKHFGVKVEVSNLSANRLDAQYYKDEYLLYEEQIKKQNVVKFVDILKQAKYGASVQAEYRSDGIPFIRGNNLSPNEIETTDIVYLDNSLVDEIGTCYVEEGDILITRSGTVGICAVVDDFHNNFAYGSFIIRLRVDNSRWNPYYIAAFLNSFWGKWQVKRLQNGAVQQNINIEEIGQILIPIVPKEQQDLVEQIVREYINMTRLSKQLINEAKQDIENLIEGKFDESKISEGV